MVLPLQNDIVYGPIKSRRLGISSGINVLSTEKKICTFNCVYCQYGWTRIHRSRTTKSDRLPEVTQVLEAVEKALRTIHPKPPYITFSGNGEPTLHPNFAEIVDGVIQLRNRFAPRSHTAILTNSTQAIHGHIRKAIAKLDLKMMKLECGSEDVFQRYNRPCGGVNLKHLVSSLQLMENVTIQALFSTGPAGNYDVEHLDEWIEKIHLISPQHVQLYTLDRRYPCNNICPLKEVELQLIKKRLQKRNISAEVYR